ncbi:hypothetical protein [Actinocrispum wychmicini]|uniref:Uncharacterized protein n=1 Tax=Actinocrispum wychmicini TaxID=1213861 RepID=A0A4R2J6X6_9PSEU|nr:hypothetical protein [Actinocrispum wychmicini]TCO54813.1 hypothetical protein EV192_108101 [Actinocrispum wychmicini]
MPVECTTGWEADLASYLTHERVKSAIVDTVRYAQLFAAGVRTVDEERSLISRQTTKLNRARPYWGLDDQLTCEDVERVLRAWQPAQR